MYDVIALGELLIDFIPGGKSDNGNVLFERNPGGAPVNVLAQLAQLGKKTGFIGKVGNDPFGHFLQEVLVKNGVDTKGLILSDEAHTTMAFVHLDDQGERSFTFSRKPGADQLLRVDEIDSAFIQSAKIFHFGSISMTDEPAYSATLQAVKYAKDNKLLISYDPNLRELLWNDLEQAKRIIKEGMQYADILKISEDELEFITNETDLERGTSLLIAQYPFQLILVTLGAKGCFYRNANHIGNLAGFKVNIVDTTGAGDAFLGAMLYSILENDKPVKDWNQQDLTSAVSFANAAGALATTSKGAITSMRQKQDIENLIEGGNNEDGERNDA
jgi:fructokinase